MSSSAKALPPHMTWSWADTWPGCSTGGDREAGTALSEDELYALEREAFVALADTEATVARIAHMLENGRPLRN